MNLTNDNGIGSGESRSAIALRPEVHSPSSIVELARLLDESRISYLFIPDIPGGFESIDISSAALGATKEISIGSGVIRLLEHDEKLLLRRIETMQSLSENRFILGVGTGSPGNNPKAVIELLLSRLDAIEQHFKRIMNSELIMPRTYIATLKVRIAQKVAGHSSGILLNFCSPEYAKKLISSVRRNEIDYACYLKVFYSRNQEIAEKLLLDEFAKYDSIKQYHSMFEIDGVTEGIRKAKEQFSVGLKIPDSLLRISLANPNQKELRDYVKRFRESGVTLPCIYPYFSAGEDPSYKIETIKKINEAL
ncbi:MAG: LLM class flavin-dependent oxidoreductase [Nitrososphaerales archaeon]